MPPTATAGPPPRGDGCEASSARTSTSTAAARSTPGPTKDRRRAVRRRHVHHPGRRAPVLRPSVRADPQGLRHPPRPGPDRSPLRRSDRRPRRRAPVRRRAGASGRALDRVPGRLLAVSPGRPTRLLDRADPGRLVPRPDGATGMTRSRAADVLRFVEAFRSGRGGEPRQERWRTSGGIDLCHVGPEFGDPDPVDMARPSDTVRGGSTRRCSAGPRRTTPRAGSGRPRGSTTAGLRLRPGRHLHRMLHAMGPARGRLLRYSQAVDPAERTCCVSFASPGLRRAPGPMEPLRAVPALLV